MSTRRTDSLRTTYSASDPQPRLSPTAAAGLNARAVRSTSPRSDSFPTRSHQRNYSITRLRTSPHDEVDSLEPRRQYSGGLTGLGHQRSLTASTSSGESWRKARRDEQESPNATGAGEGFYSPRTPSRTSIRSYHSAHEYRRPSMGPEEDDEIVATVLSTISDTSEATEERERQLPQLPSFFGRERRAMSLYDDSPAPRTLRNNKINNKERREYESPQSEVPQYDDPPTPRTLRNNKVNKERKEYDNPQTEGEETHAQRLLERAAADFGRRVEGKGVQETVASVVRGAVAVDRGLRALSAGRARGGVAQLGLERETERLWRESGEVVRGLTELLLWLS